MNVKLFMIYKIIKANECENCAQQTPKPTGVIKTNGKAPKVNKGAK